MDKKQMDLAVGGQALIEGVMMRGPEYIGAAFLRADGTMELHRQRFVPLGKRIKFWGLPILRGAVNLVEMMRIGFTMLTLSAERAELDTPGQKSSGTKQKAGEWLSMIIALALAFLLFGLLPYKTSEWLGIRQSLFFNLFAGGMRICMFVLYVLVISLMKDVRRVFQFHGAEHKTVAAFEAEASLEPDSSTRFDRRHPRCGTSFVFLVLLVSILVFSVTDTLVLMYLKGHVAFLFNAAGDKINTFWRLIYHIALVPLVAGLGYEVLKFSGRHPNSWWLKLFTWPGLSLQLITALNPEPEMLRTAACALRVAVVDDEHLPEKIVWLNDDLHPENAGHNAEAPVDQTPAE